MKCLVVTFSLVVVCWARPDVSHIPSGSYLPTGGQNIGYESGQVGSFGGIGGIDSIGGFGGIGGIGGGIGGIGGGIGGIGGGGGYQQDQKHIYFYAAPDEEQHSRFRIQIAPNSQRNTKIIFVKAPSYGGVVPEVIAPPSISEDKTLVYVLVKKPEQGGSITIPAGAGVQQTKPQVYFIKYKSQHDAQSQISGTLNGQHAGSDVPDVGNESSFVRSLDSGARGHGIGGGIGGGFIGGIGGGSHGIGVDSQHIGGHGSIGIGGGVVSGGGRYGPPSGSGPY